MQPVHELLARIRWDPEFGRGEFELEFFDRMGSSLVRVPLREVGYAAEDHFFFYYLDEDGEEHSVPFHRIRSVYKDGERIWHREPRGEGR
jgi:uncharacterized protein (UPF0248 family)